MATHQESETAVGESSFPVAALRKFIDENRIEVQAYVNLAKLWELIVCAKSEDLKRNGWIVNCSIETVQFYVYNSYDWIRLIPSHKVHAQPGETIKVHGGVFQRRHEDMVVKKEDKGTAFNVKRGHLHFWTGSAMIVQGSTIEHFKNQYQDT